MPIAEANRSRLLPKQRLPLSCHLTQPSGRKRPWRGGSTGWSRQTERLERDVGIAVETLALFVRFWLTATPALPEQAQAAARAKGAERYHAFIEALGRRIAKGPTLLREVSVDVAAAGESNASAKPVGDTRES